MPRRATRSKTGPLPDAETLAALSGARAEADAGRTILSVRDRSLLLLSAATQPEEKPRRRRDSRGEVGERRGSITERRTSIDSDQSQGDALTGMSLSEKRRFFSQTSTRITRRRTQKLPPPPPVRLEDLVRAESLLQQENIPQPEDEPCPDVGSFVKQWERRTSLTDEAPKKAREVDEPAEAIESPVLRRRTSRSILHRIQSFQEQPQKDMEREEAETAAVSRGQWTKNEAVARRRARKLESRYSAVFASELADDSTAGEKPNDDEDPSNDRPRPARAYGSSRHNTQPITRMELTASEETAICHGTTIQERLANMRNASESWRNRVSKADSPEKVVQQAIGEAERPKDRERSSVSPPSVITREAPRGRAVSTLLENRLSKLEESQQGWRGRVEHKDADKFTVEGKLRAAGLDPTQSPKVVRRSGVDLKRRSPRALSFHGRPSIDDGVIRKTPGSTSKPPLMRRVKRDVSEESDEEIPSSKSESFDESQTRSKSPSKENVRVVEVPIVADASVTEFLSPSRPLEDILAADVPELEPESMEGWTNGGPILKTVVRTVRPPGRRRRGRENPVRRKNERTDLFREEYAEVLPGGAYAVQRELRKAQVESNASEQKTAALETKLDMSEVVGILKPAGVDRTPARDCQPFKDLMLLHVKGQRQVQVRLVEPVADSINTGDSFILVTTRRVFVWLGQFSNCIEQSRARDLAQMIVKTKDLGYRGTSLQPDIVESERPNSEVSKCFWLTLGYGEPPAVAGMGGLDEDLWFEQSMVHTNAIYELQGRELVPVEDWWGRSLSRKLIDPSKAFVFDFGTELYVWLGLQVSMKERNRATSLARHLYISGYDYSECGMNPLWPMKSSDDDEAEAKDKADTRPNWTIFGRITQNAETLLFKTKFIDWPDVDRMIGIKSTEPGRLESGPELDYASSQLSPADVTVMISNRIPTACLELEGTRLQRGGSWTAVEDGLRRSYEIDTRSVTVWYASELRKTEMDPESYGQFHCQATYVVQWKFRLHVGVGGRRSDDPSTRSSGIGRERTAYFYWLGRDSSVTDKGASALFTVELDAEKGPQRRVEEGREPPALCRLFPLMTVHEGRPGITPAPSSLYAVRGDCSEEGHLVEVACQASSLRSRGSFLLLERREPSRGTLWHGAHSPSHSRDVGRHLCSLLESKAPREFGLADGRLAELKETEEGDEEGEAELWKRLGSSRTPTTLRMNTDWKPSLRIWRFASTNKSKKKLDAVELVAPHHSATVVTALPFRQDDLYAVPQPEIFLLDGGRPEACFLWLGWWTKTRSVVRSVGEEAVDDEEHEGETEVITTRTTGSAMSEFTRKRLAALKTAVEFSEQQYSDGSACRVVYAGLESNDFRELFPWWRDHDVARESQTEEGRTGDEVTAQDMLNLFCSQQFSLDKLTTRPLPEGVDPLFLEHFLDDSEFENSFKMTREAFLRLPQWKRDDFKKNVGLF